MYESIGNFVTFSLYNNYMLSEVLFLKSKGVKIMNFILEIRNKTSSF